MHIPPGDVVRVLLVDDHPVFTQGLTLLLHAHAEGRLHVAGTVRDAARAVEVAVRLQPDVALVDLVMPPPGGLAAVRALRQRLPDLRVLVLSGSDEQSAPLAALRAGASGFLPKSADPEQLVLPLLAAVQGWAVLPPEVLSRLLGGSVSGAAGLVESLSEADVALWRRVAEGVPVEQLAGELYVSERTAKRLVAALLGRLGVANRLQAAALAGRAGLLD